MTTEELNAVRTIKRRLERQKELLEDLETTGGVTATVARERVKGGSTNDVYNQIVNASAEVEKLAKELEEEKIILTRKLEDFDFTYETEKAMEHFYLNCFSISHIASIYLKYSTRQIDRFLQVGRDVVVSCRSMS